MDVAKRLQIATQIVKEEGFLDEVEPDEIINISEDTGESDYKRIAKTIVYIRKRFIENKNRVEAFKSAFPERCVVSGYRTGGSFETDKQIGEPISTGSIEVKAKRLENSKLYKQIVALLNTSLYTAYALERMKVLDYTLEKIFDDDVNDRNKVEYIKTFLQETRKPDKAKELEVSVNIQNNDVSIVNVEEKLDKIASKLQTLDAGSIIELSHNGDNR